MIILDESISCLDASKRDALIKLVAETMKNRLVFVTAHECHTGYFTETIKLSA